MQVITRIITIFLMLCLTGCNLSDRLGRVGIAPELNQMKKYEEDPAVNMELTEFNDQHHTPNSLWKPGARTFFRDQRARSVGDILKVVVAINDTVKINNKTQITRNDAMRTGIPHVAGMEGQLGKILPKEFDPSNLLSTSSQDSNQGEGKINRTDAVTTTVAATVVKILPSNNLVIRGSQEVRVNYEVREITIEGIVRPEDISAQNAVTLDQIAEARVSYGGRGNISDYQQPRYGKQVLDIITPF